MASDSQAASSYVSLVGSEAPAASSSARLSSASRDDAREEVPKVAVLPSGEMVYLSKDNPYARTYVEHADTRDLDPSERPDEDSASVPVPEPLLASFQQPLILERMGRIVRLLAMFDLVRARPPAAAARPRRRLHASPPACVRALASAPRLHPLSRRPRTCAARARRSSR